MAIPKRIKVVALGEQMCGGIFRHLTIGKEYPVNAHGTFGASEEDGVHIVTDNGTEIYIAIGRHCAFGGTYEVVE